MKNFHLPLPATVPAREAIDWRGDARLGDVDDIDRAPGGINGYGLHGPILALYRTAWRAYSCATPAIP